MKVIKWVPWQGGTEENETPEAEEAIIEDIRANGYVFSGWDHQSASTGCPMFEDGRIRTYSLRGWGRVMATAWNLKDAKGDPDYIEFYMGIPDGMTKKMPKETK